MDGAPNISFATNFSFWVRGIPGPKIRTWGTRLVGDTCVETQKNAGAFRAQHSMKGGTSGQAREWESEEAHQNDNLGAYPARDG
jgi:hypothetical protein